MKIKSILIGAIVVTNSLYAQNNLFPTTGSVGIGTNTPSSNFNCQFHGTTDYSSLSTTYVDWEGVIWGTVAGSNQGLTSRFGLTNTTTGLTGTDGSILRQSGLNFHIDNLEKKKIVLQSNRAIFTLEGTYNRIGTGNAVLSGSGAASFNILSNYDNGLFIQNVNAGKYGVYLKVASNSDNALLVYGTGASSCFSIKGSGKTQIDNSGIGLANTAFSINSGASEIFSVKGNGATKIDNSGIGLASTAFSVNTGATENFSVKGNGSLSVFLNSTIGTDKVFSFSNSTRGLLTLSNDGMLHARRIVVDSYTWADFVFEDEYYLMPLSEVNTFIKNNKHLPNIPAENEIIEKGIDMAEMNKILLQKIEELTLYMIEQNENYEKLKEEFVDLKQEIISKSNE